MMKTYGCSVVAFWDAVEHGPMVGSIQEWILWPTMYSPTRT